MPSTFSIYQLANWLVFPGLGPGALAPDRLLLMVVEMVPLKGGIGGIVHPPIGRKDTTYIPLIVLAFWGVICYLPPFMGTRNNH